MPTAYQRAQDKYYYQNWDAQEKQAKETFANNVQSLDQSVWNNAAATGNTRGSYNGYAYRSQLTPLQQNLNQTLGQTSRDRAQYAAYVRERDRPYISPYGKKYKNKAEYIKEYTHAQYLVGLSTHSPAYIDAATEAMKNLHPKK